MMRRLLVLALAVIAFHPAQPARAALPALDTETEAAPDPVPAQAIEAQSEAGSDERIASRIKAIYSELPGLSDVTLTVSEGVVGLGGLVADEADGQRAEDIAARVEGVVTVNNRIERDLSIGSSIGMLEQISDKVSSALSLLPLLGLAIAVALAIAAVGYLIAAPGALWRKIAPNGFLAGLLRSAIRFAFVIGGIVVALDMIGAGALLGAVLGGAGVIGLALGFAMRDTVENYVSSVMLSLRQPFRANDHVVIDDKEGRVIRLTSRATVLMTLDGNHLRIPNGTVFKAVILNYTRNPQRRFEFELGVDANDDATKARHLGVGVLRDLAFVLDEPAPAARVEQVGDSNIVIRFLGWIDQRETDFHKAKSRAIPAVKDALEAAGFALPEPIYRLRFDSGSPLPMQQFEGGEDAPASEGIPVTATVRETSANESVDEDVSPVEDIAQMVDKERAVSGSGDDDLLDHGRPVE